MVYGYVCHCFCSSVEEEMIRWVITLPAIWREAAKEVNL